MPFFFGGDGRRTMPDDLRWHMEDDVLAIAAVSDPRGNRDFMVLSG